MEKPTNGRKTRTKKAPALSPNPLESQESDDDLLPNDEEEEQGQRLSQVAGDPDARYPSQGEPLGIIPRSGAHDPAAPLFEGDVEFAKWAVRGKRTERTALAMVAINAENDSLISETYPVRSDYMHGILNTDGVYKPMFQSQNKPEFKMIEFGGIIALLAFILGFLLIVGLVFAP